MSRRHDPPPEGAAPPPADYVFVDHALGIDDVVGIDEVAAALMSTSGPLAVDVERASGIRYADRAFLVQVRANRGPAYLIDPESMGRTLGSVAEVLSQRPLLFHAASQDLPSLRDLGVIPHSIIDTELAGRFLGIHRVNLAAMVSEFLGISLAKAHSSADWSRRPLPETWLEYAAYDVLVLHDLADALVKQLSQADRLDWFSQECEFLTQPHDTTVVAEPWRKLSHITSLRSTRHLARARALWHARDEMAQLSDVAPKRLVPDSAIVTAARKRPRTAKDLTAIDGFDGPSRGDLARFWLEALDSADALGGDELPSRRPETGSMPSHSSWKRTEPEAAELLKITKAALSELSDELSLEPALLLKPATVRKWVWQVITEPDNNPEEILGEVFENARARPWQRELCAPVLLAALNDFEFGEQPET